MSDYKIRKMDPAELEQIFSRIEQDFLPGEYAPYVVLYEQIHHGDQEGLIFCDNGKDCAYAICASDNENGFVLISLMAVFPEFRTIGIGTLFMKSLHKLYAEKNGIIVEVEKPELSQTPEEQNSRNRRIEFYHKLGYFIVPGIDYTIWDVPMHIMALPLKSGKDYIASKIKQIVYQIYFQLMGEQYMHKLVI